MLLISCSVFQRATESSSTIILYFVSVMLVSGGELLASTVSAHCACGCTPFHLFVFLELLYHVHDLGLPAVCEKNNHVQSETRNSVWLGRYDLLYITSLISEGCTSWQKMLPQYFLYKYLKSKSVNK
jgi:hypothetical protein